MTGSLRLLLYNKFWMLNLTGIALESQSGNVRWDHPRSLVSSSTFSTHVLLSQISTNTHYTLICLHAHLTTGTCTCTHFAACGSTGALRRVRRRRAAPGSELQQVVFILHHWVGGAAEFHCQASCLSRVSAQLLWPYVPGPMCPMRRRRVS